MKNTLYPRPDYNIHREVSAIDALSLSTFLASNSRTPIDCTGYTTVTGFVAFEGGSSPTMTIVPYEVVSYEDSSGVKQEGLISAGSSIGPLNANEKFVVTIDGGRLLIRVGTLTGGPSKALIYLAGASQQERIATGRRY